MKSDRDIERITHCALVWSIFSVLMVVAMYVVLFFNIVLSVIL